MGGDRPRTHLGDRGLRSLGRHELRLPLPRPLNEQAPRIVGLEGGELPHLLTVDSEELTARRQDREVRAGAEQSRDQSRALLGHVLAVVEHEEQVAVRQIPLQRVRRSLGCSPSQIESACDLHPDRRRIDARRQIDEPRSVLPAKRLAVRKLQRQPGLPDATGPRDCHQTAAAQHLAERIQLVGASDDRR